MIKLIRAMLYRAVHDIFFYLAIVFCISFSILIVRFGGDRTRNHVVSVYDETVMVDYEKEDALNVAKHYISDSLYVHNVPGKDILYRDSLRNLYTVDAMTMQFFIMVIAVHILYVVVFFGEMYAKGAVRNMIPAGADKRKIFLSSLMMNAFFLAMFFLIGILVMAVASKASGLYPIIYLKSFAVLLLAGYLVCLVLSSGAVLIVFTVQRPFKSLLAIIVCTILLLSLNNAMTLGHAFQPKYKINNTSYQTFISESKEKDLGFEWYVPVDGFNLISVRKADGTLYSEFMTNKPDPDYPGDARVALARLLWRMNISSLPMELMVFGQYPLFRDGVMYRYIAVSSVYLCVIIAAGCAVVKRRNII